MLKKVLAVSSFVIAVAMPSFAGISPITIYNTGVTDVNGIDLHYTVVSSPMGAGPAIADVNGNFPLPPWAANDATSQWISLFPGNTGLGQNPFAPGYYTFETTFNLSGLNPATAVLAGVWSADNGQNQSGTLFSNISLNGHEVSSISGDGWNQLFAFNISSGFVSGVNTLDFNVYNEECDSCGTQNPEGLRVEFTTAQAATPEPGFYGLMALGLSGLVIVVGRRRTTRPTN